MHRSIHRFAMMALLSCGFILGAHADDVAVFINLGFSPGDGSFMFGQYGISDDSNAAYADLFVVDVAANAFVTSGTGSRTFSAPLSAGQDGSGAMLMLLPELQTVVRQREINHLRQGRLVYLRVNGQAPPSTISFRDFDAERTFSVSITQESRGSGATGSAAFHVDLTVTSASGEQTEYRIGRPEFFRNGVSRYAISRVISSDDGRSIVVVVERLTDTPSGTRVRYMVETIRLN